MSASINQLIPEMQPFARELVRAAGAAGLLPRVTSTLRSHTEQTRLYRRYLAGINQYPVAPPGTSAHEFGYAMDMVVSPMEDLPDVGRYWQQLGGLWHSSDSVHFEYPGFREDLASGILGAPSKPTEQKPALGELANVIAGAAVPGLGEFQFVAPFFPEASALQKIANVGEELYAVSPGRKVDDFIIKKLKELFTF